MEISTFVFMYLMVGAHLYALAIPRSSTATAGTFLLRVLAWPPVLVGALAFRIWRCTVNHDWKGFVGLVGNMIGFATGAFFILNNSMPTWFSWLGLVAICFWPVATISWYERYCAADDEEKEERVGYEFFA